MIEARELRLGNIVYVDNEKYHPQLKNIPLEVNSINNCIGLDNKRTYGIGLEYINQLPNTYYETYSQFIRFIKPLELTEDLLLNCGFKLETNKPNQYWYKNRLMVVRDGFFVDYGTSVRIKYLHKLQNFIYELNNEELEINL